jgi:hypothetical protein
MCRMKSTTRRQYTIAASSSSSEDDLSLGAGQEEVPASTCDCASSSAVSQRRDGVPSQHPQVPGTLEGRHFNVSLFRF